MRISPLIAVASFLTCSAVAGCSFTPTGAGVVLPAEIINSSTSGGLVFGSGNRADEAGGEESETGTTTSGADETESPERGGLVFGSGN